MGIRKAMHISQIRDFFKQTNIKKGYKKQILDYNIKKFSLIVKANLNMFFSIKILTQAKQNAALQVNSVSSAKKIIEDWNWQLEKNECQRLQYSCLSTNY